MDALNTHGYLRFFGILSQGGLWLISGEVMVVGGDIDSSECSCSTRAGMSECTGTFSGKMLGDGTAGSGISTVAGSRFSPVFAAKTVILIRQAWEGRTFWRLDSCSQFSQSSSTWSLS